MFRSAALACRQRRSNQRSTPNKRTPPRLGRGNVAFRFTVAGHQRIAYRSCRCTSCPCFRRLSFKNALFAKHKCRAGACSRRFLKAFSCGRRETAQAVDEESKSKARNAAHRKTGGSGGSKPPPYEANQSIVKQCFIRACPTGWSLQDISSFADAYRRKPGGLKSGGASPSSYRCINGIRLCTPAVPLAAVCHGGVSASPKTGDSRVSCFLAPKGAWDILRHDPEGENPWVFRFSLLICGGNKPPPYEVNRSR